MYLEKAAECRADDAMHRRLDGGHKDDEVEAFALAHENDEDNAADVVVGITLEPQAPHSVAVEFAVIDRTLREQEKNQFPRCFVDDSF